MRVAVALLCGLAVPASAAPEARPPSGRGVAIGAPNGPPLSGPALDARTDDVGALLRCPVCQGLSVADSPSTMARNMKAEVREKLAAGYDQEQILAYFERSYGEFVRLDPPMRGVNWLVWLGPLGALLAGAAGIAWMLKRSARSADSPQGAERLLGTAAGSPLPSRETLPEDPRLAGAVRSVRELAYGWPNGVPPVLKP
jgi:cytochrome c-type biogenesis protein CcmH